MKLFNTKYKFFKNKVTSVQYAIWDLEFKLSKSRQIREGVRLDRDRAIEAINGMTSQLNATEDKEKRENLEAEIAKATDNKTRYEQQMDMIDFEINGGKPTENNPSGIGILEQLKSYAELQGMYKDYLKYCG
jgi:hypothetical protein